MPVARGVHPDDQRRPVALVMVATGMAVAAAAAIWGLQFRLADPAGFRSDGGLLATPFAPDWVAVVVALAAAASLATLGGIRELRMTR